MKWKATTIQAMMTMTQTRLPKTKSPVAMFNSIKICLTSSINPLVSRINYPCTPSLRIKTKISFCKWVFQGQTLWQTQVIKIVKKTTAVTTKTPLLAWEWEHNNSNIKNNININNNKDFLKVLWRMWLRKKKKLKMVLYKLTLVYRNFKLRKKRKK